MHKGKCAHTPWAAGRRTGNQTKTHKRTHTLHQGSEEPGDSDSSKLCQTCSYTVLRDDMISLFLRRWYQKILRRNYSNWGGLEKCHHSSNLISIQTHRVRHNNNPTDRLTVPKLNTWHMKGFHMPFSFLLLEPGSTHLYPTQPREKRNKLFWIKITVHPFYEVDDFSSFEQLQPSRFKWRSSDTETFFN